VPSKKKRKPAPVPAPTRVYDRARQKEIDEFKEYVRRSNDYNLQVMWEVAEHQKKHPDHVHRCWSGSLHNVPFLVAYATVKEEVERRDLKWETPITDLWKL